MVPGALLLVSLLLGCRADDTGDPSDTPVLVDADGDGFTADVDCDDADETVHPGATEVCNGVDDDCDGGIDVDASDASTFYADADGDGFGDPEQTERACEAREGWVSEPGDCDDDDLDTFPGATEQCDEVDNDCDGEVDEDVTFHDWHRDTDGDGFGRDDDVVSDCVRPEGYTLEPGDCDDSLASVNPDATEVCNGRDDDCDDTVDVGADDASTWYADGDDDGYGVETDTVQACERPDGYAAEPGDCDDDDVDRSPGAVEQCDEIDNDCDGHVDEDVTYRDWYADSDGDGYGVEGDVKSDCARPSGYAQHAGDCDDGEKAVNPGAIEACNGVDDDCSGTPDDHLTAPQAALQAGVCAGAEKVCGGAAGWQEPVYADLVGYEASESTCDGLDNDCDGGVDNDLTAPAADVQEGVCSGAEKVCGGASGWEEPDYADISGYEAVESTCDGLDNDCDGGTDDDLTAPAADVQAGVCAGAEKVCGGASGWEEPDYTDIADYEPSEASCDGLDNDCDGGVDDDLTPPPASLSQGVCEGAVQTCGGTAGWEDPDFTAITGFEPVESTCDDLDNDCNGDVDDVDKDGDGASVCIDDCDDTDDTVYPGAPEDGGLDTQVGNGRDDDCDTYVDEGLVYGAGRDGELVVAAGETLDFGEEAFCKPLMGFQNGAAVIDPTYQTARPLTSELSPGDKVLLINLMREKYSAGNVGNHEFLDVAAVSNDRVTFVDPPSLEYGGTSATLSGQRVALFKVPQYTDVTVRHDGNDAGIITARSFDGRCYGVVAFTATGTVDLDGWIDANAAGYRGGAAVREYRTTGQQGESMYGPGTRSRLTTDGTGAGGGGGHEDAEADDPCISYRCTSGGGGGGHGTPGFPGTDLQEEGYTPSYYGEAGSEVGTVEMPRIFFGAGGGAGRSGGRDEDTIRTVSGGGGAGGGIILVRGTKLDVGGILFAEGEDGEMGTYVEEPPQYEVEYPGPGGGGAGGTIYLVGREVSAPYSPIRLEGGSGVFYPGWEPNVQDWVFSGGGGHGRARIDFRTFNGMAHGSEEAMDAAGSTVRNGYGTFHSELAP